MTQKTIEGPIQVTIDGPQGSGKTQIAKRIRDMLDSLGISDRVTIKTRQNDPTQGLLDALDVCKGRLEKFIATNPDAERAKGAIRIADAAIAKARAA